MYAPRVNSSSVFGTVRNTVWPLSNRRYSASSMSVGKRSRKWVIAASLKVRRISILIVM